MATDINNTGTDAALRRAEVYTSLIQYDLQSEPPVEGLTHDISADFPDGDEAHIPTVGTVKVHDKTEFTPTKREVIDSGEIFMKINRHKGTAVGITDKDREDSWLASRIYTEAPVEMAKALRQEVTSDLYSTALQQKDADLNLVNNYAHRILASGANGTMTIEDFAYMKTAFDKANASEMGRVAVVDGINELSFNTLTNLANVSNNARFEGIVESGFGKNHRFIRNIMGWDIYTTNKLPTVGGAYAQPVSPAGAVHSPNENGGVTNADITDGIMTQFMIAGNEDEAAFLEAWRRDPRAEFDRDIDLETDYYHLTARYGFAIKRPQTLGTILTSSTAY